MGNSKTGTPLKAVFDPAKAEAAAAVMQPREAQPAARNRKAGGRGVRISGYLPEDIDKALRDEVIRRTVEGHRPVSFNDVLCSILSDWKNGRTATP
jgi:hypothetical protein